MSSGYPSARMRLRLGCSIAALALTASIASAHSATFALPSQPLAESLKDVARLTGDNILFTPDSVSGIDAPSLSGRMSSEEAVASLLSGTHLVAMPDGRSGLIVRVADATSAPQQVAAADEAEAEAAPEQVVVSASRIAIAGYEQPTPVTVVGIGQMQRDAYTDIGTTIRNLPSLGLSSGPDNGANEEALAAGNAGEDLVNLRNLGILRTLVLVDGQRVVESISPAGLISRRFRLPWCSASMW